MKSVLLTNKEKCEIADELRNEILPEINKNCRTVYPPSTFYVKYGKRILDIAISVIALVLTLPINLIIGIITFIDLGNPIFFRQERVGKDGKCFTIIKFRNMTYERDGIGELLPPDQRVTPIGYFFRKTSLDELLNFWSILKGDMSVIGPRPLPKEYVCRYNDRHKSRLLVKPGLECPPRNSLKKSRTWNERFEDDVWYVENISLLTDIKMVIQLIRFTLNKDDVVKRASDSGEAFMGYNVEGVAITCSQVPEKYLKKIL